MKSLEALKLLTLSIILLVVTDPLLAQINIDNVSKINLVLIIFLALNLLLRLLFSNKIIIFFGYLISIFFSLEYLYNPYSFDVRDWFLRIFNIIKDNTKLFLEYGIWNDYNNEFTTLFVLLLLWLLRAISLKLLQNNKGLLVVILALGYIAIMDSYFAYDGKLEIALVTGLGLILIGIELQIRLLSESRSSKLFSYKFILALLILSSFIILVGSALPKPEATWFDVPDALEFFKDEDGSANGYRKIGYGEDDSYLGGSLADDDSIVMVTRSNKLAYWRGESKDFYTGHGWINSDYVNNPKNIKTISIDGSEEYDYPYHLVSSTSGLEKEPFEANLSFLNKQYDFYFQAGDFKKFFVNQNFALNSATLNIATNNMYSSELLRDYAFKSSIPLINEDLLRTTSYSYPEEISEIYLQIPDTTPRRVSKLAKEITSDYDNPYDQVLAINNYLRENYSYNTVNIPYPSEDEDFVDQFLFETESGYCDHFSTSMVVLTRSIGIPSRWVKGFNTGEISYEDGAIQGVVRNNNAHSWVEVYFAGVGWVPFDPTPAFRYPVYYDEQVDDEEDKFAGQNDQPNQNDEQTIEDNKFTSIARGWLDLKNYIYWILAILIIVTSYFIYRNRLTIYFKLLKIRIKNVHSTNRKIELLTDRMISLLEKTSFEKDKSQTVREYLNSVVSELDSKELEDIIKTYELARYSQQDISENKTNRIWGLWEKIIFRKKP